MKPLIVYYSYTNNNSLLAHVLQDRWQCDAIQLKERFKRTTLGLVIDGMVNRRTRIKPVSVDWQQYDFLLLIAPVWTGKIPPAIRSFIHKQKGQIPDYAFATLCGLDHNEKIPAELTRTIGHAPLAYLEMPAKEFLPPEQKEKFWLSSGYRLTEDDLDALGRSYFGF
jgi:flavodoxin